MTWLYVAFFFAGAIAGQLVRLILANIKGSSSEG